MNVRVSFLYSLTSPIRTEGQTDEFCFRELVPHEESIDCSDPNTRRTTIEQLGQRRSLPEV